MEVEVKQIAALKAETLDRLRNWGSYSSTLPDGGASFDAQKVLAKCEEMAKRVAMSRARESNRDVETTMVEVKLEVAVELARIWEGSHLDDPALAGAGKEGVKVEEEEEEEEEEDMVKSERHASVQP